MAKSRRKGRKKRNKTRNAGVVGTGGVQMMRGQQRRSSKASAQRRQTPKKSQRRSSRSVPVFYGYHSDDDYFEPRDENNKVIPKPLKLIVDWPKDHQQPKSWLDFLRGPLRRGSLADGIKKKKKKKKKSRNSKK